MVTIYKAVLAATFLGTAVPVAASATPMFDFSYNYAGVTAAGVLTAVASGAGQFTVTNITGMRNGVAITGLSTFGGADQLLFPAQTVPLDFNGLGYTAGGLNVDVFASLSFPGTAREFLSTGVIVPADGGFAFTLTQIGQVAEPGAIALFGAGLLGFAMVARRRTK